MHSDYIGRIEITCAFCGKEFSTYKSSVKEGGNFCSRSCYHKSTRGKRTLVVRKCTGCKEKFYIPRHRIDKEPTKLGGFFCSSACYHKKRTDYLRRDWPEKICDYCKQSFLVRPILAPERRYCSWSCFQKDFSLDRFGIRSQTNPERKLGSILKVFGFNFVGDGSKKVGKLFPDFCHKSKKLLVEMFGDYWHSKEEVKPRILHFKKHGYRCLVVWESDLQTPTKVTARVTLFINR